MGKTILKYFFALLLIATLTGCDSDSCSENDEKEISRAYIMGTATAGEPVSGATVSVFNRRGKLIGEFIDETQANGSFLVSVDSSDVNDCYRLEISGGVLENSRTPFSDTLRANIGKTLKNENRPIHVGFASTLVSAFMSRFGETDHDAAESTIANFLNIPSSQGLLTDLHVYNTDFSETVFAAEAAKYASLDEFNSVLLDAYLEGTPHRFTGDPMPKGAMAAAFAKGLITGAGEQIGNRATGWVLDEIFGSADEPNDPTGEVLDAITDVSLEIEELKAELERFEAQISQSLDKILTQTERNEYTTLVSTLTPSIVTIERLHDTLVFITSNAGKNDEDWKQIVVDFEKQLDLVELENILRMFQRVLEGASDTRSAIHLWGTIHTKYALTKQNHQPLFDQFQRYGNLQLLTLQLILEKRHKSGSGMPASYYVDLYLDGMKKQSEIFIEKVETMMAISQNTRLYPNSYPYARTDWLAGANGVLYDSATRESPVLAEADNIAANLMAVDPTLTVRLTYWDIVPDNWILDAPVILVNTVTHEEVSPDNTSKYSPEFPLTGHESSSNTAWKQYWYINRYVFTGLPAGTYRIKDVNAQLPKPYGHPVFISKYLQYDIVPPEDRQSNMLMTAYLMK
jgi:hypothetical protein